MLDEEVTLAGLKRRLRVDSTVRETPRRLELLESVEADLARAAKPRRAAGKPAKPG